MLGTTLLVAVGVRQQRSCFNSCWTKQLTSLIIFSLVQQHFYLKYCFQHASKCLAVEKLCTPLWIFIVVQVFLSNLPNQLMSQHATLYCTMLQEEVGYRELVLYISGQQKHSLLSLSHRFVNCVLFFEVWVGVCEEVINQKIMDFLIKSELNIFNHRLYSPYKHFYENPSFGCWYLLTLTFGWYMRDHKTYVFHKYLLGYNVFRDKKKCGEHWPNACASVFIIIHSTSYVPTKWTCSVNNRPNSMENTRLQFLRKKPGEISTEMERYFKMVSEHVSEQGWMIIAILCVVIGQIRDRFYDT